MKNRFLFLNKFLFIGLVFFAQILPFFAENKALLRANKQKINEIIPSSPISFRKNMGQWDSQILFQGASPGWNATVSFLKDQLSFGFSREWENEDEHISEETEHRDEYEYLVWNMRFQNSNPNARLVEKNKRDSYANYLLGKDFNKHQYNVPDYQIIEYINIYDHIDVRYYGAEQNLKYDYVLHPGAKIDQIQLLCEGIKNLNINPHGELEITTKWGTLIEKIPESYQIINGEKKYVTIKYSLIGDKTFGFRIQGNYDPTESLIIDPITLVWSTYIGGTTSISHGYIYDIAVDANGSVYATGFHNNNFPVTAGCYQPTFAGSTIPNLTGDVLLFKLNSSGTALQYASYIGGSRDEEATKLFLTPTGEVFVTGNTTSTDFPVTAGAIQTNYGGGDYDAFVCRLNPLSGGVSDLIYSSYLGGADDDYGQAIIVDNAGEAIVTGRTSSSDFPITQGTGYNGGSDDAFISKLNVSGSALSLSFYFGGNGFDRGHTLTMDAAGSIYMGLATTSTNLSTTSGAYDATHNNSFDLFLMKWDAAISSILYASYIGGSGSDIPYGIFVDNSGAVFITGTTASNINFPVTPGAYSSISGGVRDAFLLKTNPVGGGNTDLIFSTYIGGKASDEGSNIAVNSLGEIYLIGFTYSDNFPVTACAYQNNFGGVGDLFLCKFSADGSSLLYSSFLGGDESDYGPPDIIVQGSCANETIYLSGTTHSVDFPITTSTAFQPNKFNGGQDTPVILKLETSFDVGFTYSGCFPGISFTDTTRLCTQIGAAVPGSWQWDFGDGGSSTLQHPVHTYSSPGTYNVKLKVSCPLDSIILPVEVAPTALAVSFNAADTTGCGSFCVDFINTTANITSCLWDFGDGTSSINCSETHCYNAPGSYDVRLIVANTCTQDSLTKPGYIRIYPNPIPDFSANPSISDITNAEIFFTDSSSGSIVSWLWNFGDVSNSFATTQNTSYTYQDTGLYQVRLTVTDTNGCDSAIIKTVLIQSFFGLYIPNTFTPNENGPNDIFLPLAVGIDTKSFKIKIYNRWGELMFETNDINMGWNGKNKDSNESAPEAIYIWSIQVNDLNGILHERKGHVMLIR